MSHLELITTFWEQELCLEISGIQPSDTENNAMGEEREAAFWPTYFSWPQIP